MKDKGTISKVFTRPKKATLPTLLKFQNGKLAAIQKEKTEFCRLHATQKNVKDKVPAAMVVSNGQIYHGLVESAENELTDSYICVRDKSTNKMRFIPIEQVRLRNDIYNQLQEKAAAPELSESNRRLMLLKQFGGRKAQRYIHKQEDMKMNIDMVKSELDNTMEETVLDKSVISNDSDIHLDNIRPKFNKDATKVDEVYDIVDVVPTELLDRLDEEAKVVFATAVDKLPMNSDYLRKLIATRQENKIASAQNMLHIKIIIYMDSLLKVIKTRVHSLTKVELSGITEKVENDVRHRFSDHSKKCLRTSTAVEKALCYFIVLALLISENYQVNVSELAQELGTPRTKIVKYAQICSARPKSGTEFLSLRLPSTVPPLPIKYSRKSKK